MKPKLPHRHIARVPGLALCLGLALAPALARGPVHLHVEVVDVDSGDLQVSLNVPVTAIESMLEVLHDQLGDQLGSDFDLDFRDFGHSGFDLRQMYLALRDEDLDDFLEVNDGDEHVKIWKDREAFQLRVSHDGETRPTAMVYLPLPMLDAMFAGPDGSPPDLKAALLELEAMAPITLVEVYDRDQTVKIWLE